jgi:hypothetical protein
MIPFMNLIKSRLLFSVVLLLSLNAGDKAALVGQDIFRRNTATIDFGRLNAIPAARKPTTITFAVTDDTGITYIVLDMTFEPGKTMSDAVADLTYAALKGTGWAVEMAGDDVLTIGCREVRSAGGGLARHELLAVSFEGAVGAPTFKPKIETSGVTFDTSP